MKTKIKEETKMLDRLLPRIALSLWIGLVATSALAEKKYDPGVTDTEIKIGQTVAYSGPVSAYGTIGRTQAAYFRKINDEGGINARRINFISLDDGYVPAKTVEQVRKLIEQDQVFAVFQPIGSASNAAIQKYTNSKKVPVIFAGAISEKIADPRNYPWTLPWNAPASADGRVFGKWLLKERPNARLAILYQNDDLGKDYTRGLKSALGDKVTSMVVAEASYETSDPTVDSQIITLRASGADTLFAAVTPKFAAQAIRKVYDIGWRPTFLLSYTGASVETVLKPAGLEKSIGLMSAYYGILDAHDRKDDSAVRDYLAFMAKYYPEADPYDGINLYGYTVALTFVEILKRCGDDLTRANLMRQATSLKDVTNPMLLPGIKLNTGATDYHPIEQMQMMRFDGTRWVPFGDVIDAGR
jgi:ABC-type branched-subunit amino acid transport system substrate-binding protein